MLNSLRQDVWYAARQVRNNPVFSLVIIICLALGIGPSTATFSLVNAVLFRPVDVEAPETLVTAFTVRAQEVRLSEGLSYPAYADLRDRTKTLSGLACSGRYEVSVRIGDQSELVECEIVSPNYFDVLGRSAMIGEVFHASDNDTPGAMPLVVLGHGFWENYFGADPAVLGRTMRVNGNDFTIIGVMSPSFTGRYPVAQSPFWAPAPMMDQLRPDFPSQLIQRNHSWMQVFGRILPGTTVAQVQDEFAAISREMAVEHPREHEFMRFTVEPFSAVPRDAQAPLAQISSLIAIVVFLVLLLSCSSTAAMQLARATVRRREIAIRMAVGASRWRIIRQLLVESVFVALLAGGLALLLTLWAFESYKFLIPEDQRPYFELGSAVDWRLLGFTLFVSVLAGILFGLAPAWQMSKPDLLAPLKSQDAGGDFGSARVRNVLVTAQFAMAVVLLICSGLFLRGLSHAATLDPGFEDERLVLFQTDLSLYGYSPAESVDFVEQLTDRLAQIPGIESVSASRFPPLSRSSSNTHASPLNEDLSTGPPITVGVNIVGPGYFATTGIPLVAGREFTRDDVRGGQAVVVINETLAKAFGGSDKAVGRLVSAGLGEAAEIVGVAKDSKYWNLGEENIAFGYTCLAQTPTRELTFCMRTSGDAAAMKAPIEDAIRETNPDLALSTVQTIEEHSAAALQTARTSAILFAILGALALTLAVIGIYGVVAYSVARRQLEIGVRMALGGQPRDLVRLLVRRGLALAAIGAAIGIVIALAVTPKLEPLLHGGNPWDPQAFVLVPLLLLAVAWLGIYLPARKATSVDPMVVLRYE